MLVLALISYDALDRCRFKILLTLLVSQASHLEPLVQSEARIVLLYSTREEARSILKVSLQLTFRCTI